MVEQDKIVYPYIPNSVPEVERQMLEEVEAASTEDFYGEIPEELRLRRRMPTVLLS